MAKKRRKKRGKRRNPLFNGNGMVGSLTKGVTRAFSMDAIKTGSVMVGGAVINSIIRDLVAKQLGIVSRPLQYALGLGTAGLLGMGANRVLPGSGQQVFMGALTFELARAYNEFISSKMGLAPASISGIGDFLIQPQVTGATPSPMGDFLIQPQVTGATPAPMGGFLDPYYQAGFAGMGDMSAIGEEMGADLGGFGG
jgi:hypothetical protein